VGQQKLALVKRPVKKPKQTTGYSWQSYAVSKAAPKDNPLDDTCPLVNVLVRPDMLENLELIWTIVLESTDEEVTDVAGSLLVRLHTSLDEPMRD
jgi:hypothetical protein